MVAKLNRIVKSINEKSLFDECSALVDATVSYKQGDLLVIAAGKLAAAAAGELGTAFVGISRQSIALGKPLSPYIGTDVDAAQAIPALIGPCYGVVAKLIAKVGDAFAVGCPIFIDGASGAYHVTSVGALGAVAIGLYQGAAIASAVAGQEVECLLGACYPLAQVQF